MRIDKFESVSDPQSIRSSQNSSGDARTHRASSRPLRGDVSVNPADLYGSSVGSRPTGARASRPAPGRGVAALLRAAWIGAALAAAPAAPAAAQQAQQSQPYAGQQERGIASLPDDRIADLLAGRGASYALPAELNGYPGPTHLIELADELALDDAQLAQIEAVFADMNARARTLGADLVTAEAALDDAFEAGNLDAERLSQLTAESARIEAELRATHLAAHLEVAPLLTRHQRTSYDRLRGYADGGDHGGH